MRTISLLALVYMTAVAQPPVFGPVSIEGRGSLTPPIMGSSCNGPISYLGGMNSSRIVFCTPCQFEPNDTNLFDDVYVRDFLTGNTLLVSVTPSGVGANDHCYSPRISGDGQTVVFGSNVTNLVSGGTPPATANVYARDLVTGITTLMSIGLGGALANGDSWAADVSHDGRFVTFTSYASNLVVGDTEGMMDAFIYDRQTGVTSRVSQTITGIGGNNDSYMPLISGDGNTVVYLSRTTNLVPNYAGPGFAYVRVLAFDRLSQAVEVVSVGNSGLQPGTQYYRAAVSHNGQLVAFWSDLPIEPGASYNSIYVRNRSTGTTKNVAISSTGTPSNGSCFESAISGNGRFVVFVSNGNNLVPNDTNGDPDVFVHDLLTGMTIRANVNALGQQAVCGSFYGSFVVSPGIDFEGRRVSFWTDALNLGPQPWQVGWPDLYLADLGRSQNVGMGTAGGLGMPYSRVVEQAQPLTSTASLVYAMPNMPALFGVCTGGSTPQPFGTGMLVPWPLDFVMTTATDAEGVGAVQFQWPASLPSGTQLWAQWGIFDPLVPLGLTLSNGFSITRP